MYEVRNPHYGSTVARGLLLGTLDVDGIWMNHVKASSRCFYSGLKVARYKQTNKTNMI